MEIQLYFGFITRFIYTLVVLIIIAYLFYYRNKGKAELLFTYIVVGSIIFMICVLLSKIPLEIGFAIGLFAVFSIVRYRSIPFTPREMTYLLASMGIAVKNGLTVSNTPFIKILITDIMLIVIIGVIEYFLLQKKPNSITIIYDNLSLLQNGKDVDLIADIEFKYKITGLVKYKIVKIDSKKGTATLELHYKGDDTFVLSTDE